MRRSRLGRASDKSHHLPRTTFRSGSRTEPSTIFVPRGVTNRQLVASGGTRRVTTLGPAAPNRFAGGPPSVDWASPVEQRPNVTSCPPLP